MLRIPTAAAVLAGALLFTSSALADPFSGRWDEVFNGQPGGTVTFTVITASEGISALEAMGGTPCEGTTTYYDGAYAHPGSYGSGRMTGCTTTSAQGHVHLAGRWDQGQHAGRFDIALCTSLSPSPYRFDGGWYADTGASFPYSGSRVSPPPGNDDCDSDAGGGGGGGGSGGGGSGGGGGGGGASLWADDWQTSFGLMHLVLSGDGVSGTYAYCNGHATIDGSVSDGALDGTWKQPCNSKHGRFHFVLNSTGTAFTGTWNYGTRQPKFAWNGTRS